MYRIGQRLNNESLLPFIVAAVKNETLHGTTEHIQLMCLVMNFYTLSPEDTEAVTVIFNKLRVEIPECSAKYLDFINDMQEARFDIDGKAEMKASTMIDREVKDDVSEYYRIADIIHSQSYINEDVMQVVKQFYDNHEGLSTVNESIRRLVYAYLHRFITKLKTYEYTQYFEISKTFSAYMSIFDNEHFNQNLRDISLVYMAKCLHVFQDKRAKEYQDVKRFVASHFENWHFMKEKEVVEMFKTRRKRKTAE